MVKKDPGKRGKIHAELKEEKQYPKTKWYKTQHESNHPSNVVHDSAIVELRIVGVNAYIEVGLSKQVVYQTVGLFTFRMAERFGRWKSVAMVERYTRSVRFEDSLPSL